MIINNGAQATLVIKDVHDGFCGVQGGKLSFKPNLALKAPESAAGALLNGDPIRVSIRKSIDNPGFYLAAFEALT